MHTEVNKIRIGVVNTKDTAKSNGKHGFGAFIMKIYNRKNRFVAYKGQEMFCGIIRTHADIADI